MTFLLRATDASHPRSGAVGPASGDLIFIGVLYNGTAPSP